MESINLRHFKKPIMKHSTPKKGSIWSKNKVSFPNQFTSLSPLPNKLIQVSSSSEDNPGGWNSKYMKKRDYETMTIFNGEPSNSSQIILPTIIEESTEAFHQASPFPKMSRKTSSNCNDAQSNEGLFAATEQTKIGQAATISKESITKSRKKRNRKKELVLQKEWELRQLKNIEETTTHELTIE